MWICSSCENLFYPDAGSEDVTDRKCRVSASIDPEGITHCSEWIPISPCFTCLIRCVGDDYCLDQPEEDRWEYCNDSGTCD